MGCVGVKDCSQAFMTSIQLPAAVCHVDNCSMLTARGDGMREWVGWGQRPDSREFPWSQTPKHLRPLCKYVLLFWIAVFLTFSSRAGMATVGLPALHAFAHNHVTFVTFDAKTESVTHNIQLSRLGNYTRLLVTHPNPLKDL